MMGLGRAFGGMKMRSRRSRKGTYGMQEELRHCYYRYGMYSIAVAFWNWNRVELQNFDF